MDAYMDEKSRNSPGFLWFFHAEFCDNLDNVKDTILALLPLTQPDYHIYWILLFIWPRLARIESQVIDMIRGMRHSRDRIKSKKR